MEKNNVQSLEVKNYIFMSLVTCILETYRCNSALCCWVGFGIVHTSFFIFFSKWTIDGEVVHSVLEYPISPHTDRYTCVNLQAFILFTQYVLFFMVLTNKFY